MTAEGGSAREKAEALRKGAAEARLKADRMDSMASNYEAGDLGERRVAAALAPLEGKHCRVLHDRLLRPGQSKVNLDHIVVSVAGTYLIDAKNWSGAVFAEGGSLYQRARSGRWLHNGKLDKVRRMAEEMELRTSTVIDPVLCLAGDGSAEFGEPTTVRGVFVVPVGQLASWLLARPRDPSPDDLHTRAIRLAVTFPSATAPAFGSNAPMLGHRGSHPPAQRPPAPRRPAPRPPAQRPPAPAQRRPGPQRGSSRAARGSDSRRAALVKLIFLVILLSVVAGPGQRLSIGGAETAAKLIAGRLTPSAAPVSPPAWAPPCRAVSDAAVASAIGQKVYRYIDGTHDTCTWGFVPRPNSTAPGNLRIVTGWDAQHSAYPTGPAARLIHTATSEVLTVPQLAAVPGQAVATASQPMLLVLTWKSTPLTSARARQAVLVLAGVLARSLPTGAGATQVVRR